VGPGQPRSGRGRGGRHDLLGAAAVRVATRQIDKPPETASYWAYLGLEVACGTASLASAITRRRGAKQA
jgi:hypothetical protein